MIVALMDAIWGPLGALLALLASIAGAWLAGARHADRKAENERLRADEATRKRIKDATQDHLGDNPSPATLAEWLRERGERGGSL
ncbi:hypothetical protein [Hoeflea sp.]|uniref:hypothetical protein n=1 Tax=Hoeflea sp. TaxID=1940281 RepID=UPI00199C0BF8|nr:hypothetical protein [Hoeflea sp.]MBC7286131.1 hypothetical protein [Hoeflea sp.]